MSFPEEPFALCALVLCPAFAIVAWGAICVAHRVRRAVAMTVLLAGVLPLGGGLLRDVWNRHEFWSDVVGGPRPLQAELDSVLSDRSGFVLGLAGTVICCAAGIAALMRSTPEEPSVTAPEDGVTDGG